VRPDIVVEAVKQHIWAVMPNVGIDATSVEEALHRFTLAAPRFASVIMGALALVAVFLVVTGVFSVMAYVVALRTHEIGVRMAVGANRTDVVRMMMKSALVTVAIGCAIGTVMSLGLTQILESQLWGVSSRDPWTFTGAMMLMVVTGGVASILPAVRSARVDPVVALRCE
jgi:ABC-type antimicrobial peptide transport system permease subunit